MTYRYRFHTLTIQQDSVKIIRDGQDDDKATYMDVAGKDADRLQMAKDVVDLELGKIVQP